MDTPIIVIDDDTPLIKKRSKNKDDVSSSVKKKYKSKGKKGGNDSIEIVKEMICKNDRTKRQSLKHNGSKKTSTPRKKLKRFSIGKNKQERGKKTKRNSSVCVEEKLDSDAILDSGKRKRSDDSIEICDELYIIEHVQCKKQKTDSEDQSTIESTNKTDSINTNDDVVIVESPCSSDDEIVIESVETEVQGNQKTSHLQKKKKKFLKKSAKYKQISAFNDARTHSVSNNFSTLIVDRVGSFKEYESPLRSIKQTTSNSSDPYHNVNGSNMYNPSNVEKIGLRPVVIDGNNVAYGHGKSFFSTRGIEICINYFLKRGHKVHTFVPLYRRSEVSLSDRALLDNFQKNGQLIFTPSRYLNGRCVVPYDDRFIVQCAAELGGVIVSTDNYRDLIDENASWRETIENRLLMFTWVGDMLMFPIDPNGRHGPKLEEFLKFPKK